MLLKMNEKGERLCPKCEAPLRNLKPSEGQTYFLYWCTECTYACLARSITEGVVLQSELKYPRVIYWRRWMSEHWLPVHIADTEKELVDCFTYFHERNDWRSQYLTLHLADPDNVPLALPPEFKI